MNPRLALYIWLLSVALAQGLGRTPARAQASPALHSYAVIIGSNPGGPGQARLQYAERDARQVAALMGELGRTPTENTRVLLGPSAAEVRAVLSALKSALATHAQRGDASQLLFYYSGHARAQGINLGAEVLPLSELRNALLALPATLKVVVLDACQSGAFSNVKGATPTADFSFNSVRRLDTQGVAVLASSSGAELSQESAQLGASFFTHHVVSALRGAGDVNADGRVSLDELYRYAYEHTLADTARTAVGGQHVTLETDLKGKGDVSLSYPSEASAHLSFAADVEANLLVQQVSGKSVMAELHKAKGAPVKLALPAGAYSVTVRMGEQVRACSVTLSDGSEAALDPARCAQVESALGLAKGPERTEGWFFELGMRIGGTPNTAYTDRLAEFSYDDSGPTLPVSAALLGGVSLLRNLGVFVRYAGLDWRHFDRQFGNEPSDAFSLRSHGLGLGARARLPLAHEWIAFYAQLTAGASLVRTDWSAPDPEGVRVHERKHAWGPWVEGAVGFQGHIIKNFGLFVEGGWGYSNALENLLGEHHNNSAGFENTGLRLRTMGVK